MAGGGYLVEEEEELLHSCLRAAYSFRREMKVSLPFTKEILPSILFYDLYDLETVDLKKAHKFN